MLIIFSGDKEKSIIKEELIINDITDDSGW